MRTRRSSIRGFFNWPNLCLGLLIVLCAALTWRPLQGVEDFWAHAAVGRWIAQNHSIPQQTLWLWSTAPQRWIAHSWLSEVFLYTLMKIGGVGFVLFITIAFVAIPFGMLWRLWVARGGSTLIGVLLFAFAINCTAVRFQPRPELFSYFFLTILLLFLIAERQGETRRWTYEYFLMAAMFGMWANMHGGVALGLAVLFLTAVCEAVESRKLPRSLWLLVLGALAININPYGIEYWNALRPVGGEMFSMIDEWKSPLAAPALPPIAIGFVLMVVITALLAWLKNSERRWSQLAWLLFFLAFFFSARRNLWPLMNVSLAVAAANAQSFNTARLLPSLFFTPQARVVVRAVWAIVLLAWIVSVVSPEAFAVSNGAPRLVPVSRYAPRGMSDWVSQHHPPDPVFNDYLRSGYLHWQLQPQRKLYIDLLNAYPDDLLREYFEIIKCTPNGKKRFEALNIRTVIIGRWTKQSRILPLVEYLNASTRWKQEYSGPDGAVWVRRE